ncbi:hypothetical protein RJ639_013128 [Escallonia herrerae]|uniref:Uncharacterized protein n=1 Tax=Escallonia herrerae TaxID=1293975 RepID=A0AA88VHB0_9ASTE|nr:hypothetical protein RJ639_013128 [Escallonia herrerae]
MSTATLLCSSTATSPLLPRTKPFNSKPSLSLRRSRVVPLSTNQRHCTQLVLTSKDKAVKVRGLPAWDATRRNSAGDTTTGGASPPEHGGSDNVRRGLQLVLWLAEGIYILWLFLLPYAPGDPVWAISSDTVNSLVGLSLNFFFLLPLMNSGTIDVPFYSNHDNFCYELVGRVVGIRLIDAPVLHPMSEGLFNFVIGWTFMFAPLLFTDRKRNRYKESLDVLWGFQMFLTNRYVIVSLIELFYDAAFLIPYMAIRLNEADAQYPPRKASRLGSVMTNGATIVGVVGGAVCLISTLWALFGRADGNFGSLTDRWEFLVSYLGSERLAYAFIWDICLYIVFQPWLIGDNLQNVQEGKADIVKYLRFVPVFGLVAYLLCLKLDEEDINSSGPLGDRIQSNYVGEWKLKSRIQEHIDDISGLVEEYNHLLLGYPWLALEGGLELFPCIFPRPKIVRTQRNGAVTRYHLIEAETDVLLHPNELQH